MRRCATTPPACAERASLLEAGLRAARGREADAGRRGAEFEGDAARLRDQLQAVEAEVRRLGDELSASRSAHSAAVAGGAAVVAAKDEALSLALAATEDERSAKEIVEEELRAVKALLTEIRSRAWSLERRIETSEARERAAAGLAQEAQTRLSSAENTIEALEARLGPAEAAVDDARASRAASAMLRSRLWLAERRSGERVTLQARVRDLETALAAAEEDKTRLGALADEHPKLTSELEALRARLRGLEAGPAEAETRRQTETEALRARLASAQSEIDTLTKQIHRGREKLAGQVGILGRVQSARRVSQSAAEGASSLASAEAGLPEGAPGGAAADDALGGPSIEEALAKALAEAAARRRSGGRGVDPNRRRDRDVQQSPVRLARAPGRRRAGRSEVDPQGQRQDRDHHERLRALLLPADRRVHAGGRRLDRRSPGDARRGVARPLAPAGADAPDIEGGETPGDRRRGDVDEA